MLMARCTLAERGLVTEPAGSCREGLQYCRDCSGIATIASRRVAMHQVKVSHLVAASRGIQGATVQRYAQTPGLQCFASIAFMSARLNVECPVLGFWGSARVRRDAASRKLRERVSFQRFAGSTRECCANPAQRSAISRLVTPATRGSLLDGSTSSTTPGL